MRVVLVAILLAGCSGAASDPAPDHTQPLHHSVPPDAVPEHAPPDDWVDCDALSSPEAWYAHSGGSLWCEQQSGPGGASGSAVTPVTPLFRAYTGSNGSAGHPSGTPVEAHVLVACWTGVCLADVTVRIFSNGTQVAILQKQEPVVDVILLGGVWVDLDGALATDLPPAGVLSMEVEVSGVGPAMLLGFAGSQAPWFVLG